MTYARTGITVADAFVSYWRTKYYYYSERPSNFIQRFKDKDLPFPAFPLGHSMQISAGVEVLIDLFGNDVHIYDDSNVAKAQFVESGIYFVPRTFKKLSDIAAECGISRLYGGIHTTQDNDVGLAEGKKVGKNINNLKWTK